MEDYFFFGHPKGQIKSKLFFQAKVTSKNWMNEFNFTTMKTQVNLFSFVFWRKLKTPKIHFEIIWSLRMVFERIKDFQKPLFVSYLSLITLCRPFIWRRAEKNHDSWVKFKFNLVGNCTAIALLQNFLEKLYWASFNFIVKVRQRKSKTFAQITRKALKEYSLLFRNLHWEVFFNTTKLL